MKYDKLIERLQKLIGFTPKQAELCKILDYTSSKISLKKKSHLVTLNNTTKIVYC